MERKHAKCETFFYPPTRRSFNRDLLGQMYHENYENRITILSKSRNNRRYKQKKEV